MPTKLDDLVKRVDDLLKLGAAALATKEFGRGAIFS
jgi:hypothetical protein